MSAAPPVSKWEAVCDGVQSFWRTLGRSKTVNVNSTREKDSIKAVVQQYFRAARPELRTLGMTSEDLATIDAAFQELLRLTNGNNLRRSYRRWATVIRDAIPDVSGRMELLLGTSGQPQPATTQRAPIEAQIRATLAGMIPSAALSYEQAIIDLADANRGSFRGPAVELREALREILDHLAPDQAVMKSEGFKLEKDRTTPTFRQKVHFILKARGRTKAAMSAPEDTAAMVERTVGDLARSVYTQGSLAAHVAGTRREVMQLKRYVEAVLSDILEL